ncbi:hypothetical protein Xbed_03719 [Xenorhabdus beddingii]|uniref:Uncharacterized protein n=1 Tax=Xenorhabdus beddingii TaxID=40578 RepID=A0A1Y2S6D5_9GAMM|nr:hypothetical protein Xbed_03719 [Xenorhabdus beddingii]
MEIVLSVKEGNVSEEITALNINSDNAAVNLFLSKLYRYLGKEKSYSPFSEETINPIKNSVSIHDKNEINRVFLGCYI